MFFSLSFLLADDAKCKTTRTNYTNKTYKWKYNPKKKWKGKWSKNFVENQQKQCVLSRQIQNKTKQNKQTSSTEPQHHLSSIVVVVVVVVVSSHLFYSIHSFICLFICFSFLSYYCLYIILISLCFSRLIYFDKETKNVFRSFL